MKKNFPSTNLPFKYNTNPLSGNIINGLGDPVKTKATQVFHGSGARDLEWGKLELFFALINPFKVYCLNLYNRWLLRDADGIVSRQQRSIKNKALITKEIKELGISLGAGSIGVTKMTEEATYKGGEVKYKNAIVILYPMDHDEMQYVTTDRAGTETMRAYMEISKVAIGLSKKIRNMGWRARAYCEGADLLHIPLAIAAGLGELGKHGSLISREFGSSMRIATVLTDLPLHHDTVQSILQWMICVLDVRSCTIDCPVDAISDQKQTVRGIQKWYVDFDKCAPYFTEAVGCGICIEVCPWSKPDRGFSLSEKLLQKRNK
jgi:NAD-dependent dihydropyrimidine dehydrogenase PreA subunit